MVHLISKHENDLKEALIQSVMAGGDSASRGMLVGMILGAHLGEEGIPKGWLAALQKKKAIEDHDRAIELNPNDAKSYILRGVNYSKIKKYKKGGHLAVLFIFGSPRGVNIRTFLLLY